MTTRKETAARSERWERNKISVVVVVSSVLKGFEPKCRILCVALTALLPWWQRGNMQFCASKVSSQSVVSWSATAWLRQSHPPNFSCFLLPFYSLPRSDLHSCVKNHTSQVNWQKKTRSTSLFCCIRSVSFFVHDVIHKQLCCHSAGSGARTIGGKRGRWQEKKARIT